MKHLITFSENEIIQQYNKLYRQSAKAKDVFLLEQKEKKTTHDTHYRLFEQQ